MGRAGQRDPRTVKKVLQIHRMGVGDTTTAYWPTEGDAPITGAVKPNIAPAKLDKARAQRKKDKAKKKAGRKKK